MMMHLKKCGSGKLCLFLTALLCLSFSAEAQNYEDHKRDFLQKLDLSGLGNRLFLNAAITTPNEVAYLKNLSKPQFSDSLTQISAEEWHNLYERIVDADLQQAVFRLKDVKETDRSKVTGNSILSIGILNLRSIYFTGSEISENEKKKARGETVDFSRYQDFDIVYASLLQEEVFQSDIWFKADSTLYFDNHSSKVLQVAVDLNDGKGYQQIKLNGRPVQHHFDRVGKHLIHIRITTEKKEYFFASPVFVKQLVREVPYAEFKVDAARISTDTILNRSSRTALVGGNIRIVLGCDNLLNKPIIIAEGFDMGESVNLDDIEANYRTPLNQYLTEGYDLVLLDYTDGRAPIEDNAQVLKALIQQVNQMKSGNAQSVIIGESMSGLVARWALRQMENEGIAHQVKLMICYDTPHQGANVPVALTQLAWETTPTLLTQVILKFFAKGWRDYYLALATPATQQLLLHWGGKLTGGVGSKSPLFDSFRANLNALGNGRYPQNCRNIAVVHGSLDASDQSLFDDYNYGSRILRSWTPIGLQNTNIDLHTNQLGANTNIFRFAAWGLLSKTLGVSRNYQSDLNDDFLPGGVTAFSVPNKLFNKTKDFDFCFVPTFSSIDFQGPRHTQGQRLQLNVINSTPALTPFQACYGGDFPELNTRHVSTRNIDCPAIGVAENLLANIPACPVLPKPPIPVIAVYNTCYPFSEKRTTEDNTANITVTLVTPSSGKYVHNWTVLPSNQYFTTIGDQIVFQAERADHYDVICVRTYPDRRDLSSTFKATFNIADCNGLNVLPQKDIDSDDIWEDDFLLTTASDSAAVFAHVEPVSDILYASRENGVFVSRSELINSGMFIEFASLFAMEDPRVPLPVTLESFTIAAEGERITLSWSTASETNSSHFEVQRSNDGRSWETIGNVNAQTESSGSQTYTFNDASGLNATVFYRLKMVDMDGKFAFSTTRSHSAGSRSLSVYPNPADNIQYIPDSQNVKRIELFDMNGKLIRDAGSKTNTVDMHALPAGKFILRIHTKDGKVISKEVLHH